MISKSIGQKARQARTQCYRLPNMRSGGSGVESSFPKQQNCCWKYSRICALKAWRFPQRFLWELRTNFANWKSLSKPRAIHSGRSARSKRIKKSASLANRFGLQKWGWKRESTRCGAARFGKMDPYILMEHI